MVAVRLDRRLLARVDPSDVVQEALADADRRLDEYLRERPVAFYPWLRRLAEEQLVNVYRRHVGAARRSVTLAAAIVAFQTKTAAGVRLIDDPVINTVLVLVVVTSILGPILTEFFGRQRLAEQAAAARAAAILPQTANQAAGEVSDPVQPA
jgi:DNA-directed RNA polymerase specialized sigma24 family protein